MSLRYFYTPFSFLPLKALALLIMFLLIAISLPHEAYASSNIKSHYPEAKSPTRGINTETITSHVDLNIENISHSKEWLNLLHYKKNIIGKSRSLLDGEGYFFSPEGKTDPRLELVASIKAMENANLKVGKYNLHPQCAFPTRYQFLKKNSLLKTKDILCPKLDEYLSIFRDPQNISVVFSSAYPNNPASMFGHTFLKVNSKNNSDLTDIGINFAAQVPDDENAFAFVYFGLTGGYKGVWSTTPYHEKIKEYLQGENRDLWEYELNLSPDETKRILLHLWEMETNSYFEYYFFDENCSYQILAAIEAIRPDLNLLDHTIYLIPGESIKNLFKYPDLVKKIHFRPSIQKKFFQKFDSLNKEEKSDFYKIIKSHGETSAQPLVLETAIIYYDFQNIKKKGQLNSQEASQRLKILSQRASLGITKNNLDLLSPIPKETQPDLGHDSYAFFVGPILKKEQAGSSTHQTLMNFRLRSAYHDLLNNDLGYKRYSQIEFPSLQIQYNTKKKQLRLDEFNFLNIIALPPISLLSRALSWKINTGIYSPKDYGCSTCRHAYLDLGFGSAFNLFNERNLFYSLLTARGELYHKTYKGFRYGPGFTLGFLTNPIDRTKFSLIFNQFWDLDAEDRPKIIKDLSFQNSIFYSRNRELRTTLNWLLPNRIKNTQTNPDQFSAKFELLFFFH